MMPNIVISKHLLELVSGKFRSMISKNGFNLNPINIAVIPLVIGMGIDFGIHLAHRYKVEQEITTVYRYTGKGVLLSALATMIGFGSLGLIGTFGSISSMGIILFIGLAACLTAALVVLPALLRFDSRPVRPLEKRDSYRTREETV